MTHEYRVGQKIRVIGDTFVHDPHELEIGSVHTIEDIYPAIPFDEIPIPIQLFIIMENGTPYDLPPRVHVVYGDGEEDYANLVFEDIEPYEDKIRVRLDEDDYADGFGKGYTVDAIFDEEVGEHVFEDMDGDKRALESFKYTIL